MGKALDIVNKFLQGQDDSVVADDFKFIGPVDQTEGKEAFMKLNAAFFPLVRGMRMLQQFENGNNVCSIYEMDLEMPSGKKPTLKIADWAVVKSGKIVQSQIVYDPRDYVAEMS